MTSLEKLKGEHRSREKLIATVVTKYDEWSADKGPLEASQLGTKEHCSRIAWGRCPS